VEPVPISLITHHAFCPRRAWLEAAGEKTDTMQMAVGTRDHEVVDDSTRSRTARVRAFDVAAEGLGVVGRCDTVEVHADGSLTVVEHKSTPVRQRPEVTAPTRLQLALQVLALRDMGLRVDGAAVWFSSHGVRVPSTWRSRTTTRPVPRLRPPGTSSTRPQHRPRSRTTPAAPAART
jgi:CRISPR-associated protein Cas1